MKCPDCTVEVAQDARFCSSCGAQLHSHERFILGVDLDGVVADLYAALRPIAAEWRGVEPDELTPNVSYGLTEWGIGPDEYHSLHRFAVTQRQIFSTLPPVPGAPAVLRRLGYNDSIRIRIITHRLYVKYTHEISVRQTTEWLEEHGIPYWDICFMRTKGDVGAHLYIEDSPSNIRELMHSGKKVLIFTNSTNGTLEGPRANTWEEAEKMVLTEVEKWKSEKK